MSPRVHGSTFARVALFVVAFAVVAPACAGRSIRAEDDDLKAVPSGGGVVAGGSGGSRAGVRGGNGSGIVGGTSPTPPQSGGRSSGDTVVSDAGALGGTPSVGGSCGRGGGHATSNDEGSCRGIASGNPCAMPRTCEDLVCGIADSGRRTCTCNERWTCEPCNFDCSPFRDLPAELPTCPPEAADEVPCATEYAVCGPVGNEYCACYADFTDGLIWDCDDAPSTWGL